MPVASARDAADLLAPLLADAEGETLAVLHLDRERRVIARDCWPLAPGEGLALPMRAIFTAALGHDTAGLVVAHSRRSGDPRPSRAEKAATRRLAEAAAALDIVFHDHLILAGGEWRSLRQMGLL